ncbi:MAG TPA: FAD-binding oxidoreductase [Ktedonobacterales bacterium]
MAQVLKEPEREFSGWGMRDHAQSHFARPADGDGLAAALAAADARGATVCLRGGGNSYGDAAILQGGLTLDCSAASRILAWDPETGVVTVEPGVTIANLWRHVLPDGWRPPVVPGRGSVTVAGAAAANIHGKNNWRMGAFGDHILSFELALPGGQWLTCSPDSRPDLFVAAIGGVGLLGVFTRLTLQMRRVYSGLVAERQTAQNSLGALLAAMEAAAPDVSDMVAWVDASATGPSLGRGLLAEGRELAAGEDPRAAETLARAWPEWPAGPARLLRYLPAGLIPTLARPMSSHRGAALANRAQWAMGSRRARGGWERVPYPAANFPLDIIPNWQYSYLPGGLIQHQAFLSLEAASAGFAALIQRAHAAGLPPSLAVMKKQRASEFTLNYLLDGYSLALDFPVHRGEEARMLALASDLNDITLDYGGRLYFAKDSTLTPAQVRRMLPPEALATFAALKSTVDPRDTLQTELYRRALRPALTGQGSWSGGAAALR